jgi:flagella basal body P-ring formation protein FlgA
MKSAGFSRRVFVRTVAEVLRPQPVLRSSVSAHSAIRKEDLEWKVAPQGKGQPLKSPDNLEGFAAKRDLKAGEVLTADLLYSPILVRKGDPVTVKATSGGITIAATMRAKAAAHYGETISVEHLTGTGTATARVIGPGLLEALQGVK